MTDQAEVQSQPLVSNHMMDNMEKVNDDKVSLIRSLEGRVITSIAWSPDGKKFVSGDLDGMIKIRDVETGELIHSWKGDKYKINTIAWSPDGMKIVSDSTKNMVQVWDAETGALIHTWEVNECVDTVTWSPDGTKILVGISSAINIWDVSQL